MEPKKQLNGLSKILALDIATSCGWALWNKGKIKFDTELLHNSQWDGAGMRFLKLRVFLEKHKDVGMIVYENVMNHSSIYAGHAYGGFLAVIQQFCEEHSVPYTSYGVGQIKKSFTGSGSAKKEAMIKEARLRGHNVKDDNQADALAVLYMGLEEFKGLLKQP